MDFEKEERYQVFIVGDREFKLYYEKDERDLLILPDFATNAEYTDEGHPFRLMIHDECPKCTTKGEICGGCGWFVHEKGSPIGICMNEVFRRSPI